MKIFCSGIGGIGLSAYAALQHAAGHSVRGSDRSGSALIDDLQKQGIVVTLTQDGSAIPKDCDLFVYSEAIPEDSPERLRATELGIKSQSYFQALGDLCRGSHVIAVCGTHGKSSTTAMAARVLMESGLDPTVVVGTKVRELNGRNWRKGSSDIFLVEACEYRRSFHFINPSVVLMTNVDGDHFDAFATMDDYHQAFIEFLERLPKDGVVITHGRDADCAKVAASSGRKVIDADTYPLIPLQTPGLHMRQNAQLVLALATHLHLDDKKAQAALAGFAGTWRRMEVKGQAWNGITVIDDYAHHPTEIRATLSALREAYPNRRIICVFQPHTHDRTLKLYDAFVAAFSDADMVIVPNVYNARSDIESQEVDVTSFVHDIGTESEVDCFDGESLEETQRKLETMLPGGEVIVTMGAGDITKLSDRLIEAA
jgi:UDP-N-acetylmuramate--alanine ligase